ncbi:MAG TPA: DNA cytosine methyltransferase [Streptosporangiaceae bacterium]|nr:DNA cytosine methyltransferase [Streptosporangiaceae bacterium]
MTPASGGPLTAVSLFAGIGGLDLACQRAGIAVTAAAEIDPACRAVLGRHFPQTTLFEDVTEVTDGQLRATGFVPGRGVLAAGSPCQGNSIAGRRSGLADPRSGLWRHVVRLLAETRPRWFLGENVPGLLSIHHGRDFAAVLADLDDLGYGVAWRVLDAQWFGVPQRRRRVFLAGCLGDGAAPVQVLLEPESGGGHPPQGRQAAPEPAGTTGRRARGPRAAGPGGHHVASTLQGGGRRGHRVDAEGAAGGHLIAYSLNPQHGRNDLEETWVTHALTAEGTDTSEDGTGRGTPLVAVFAPLTAGTPPGPGVTAAGRRMEDDSNLAAAGQAVRRLTPREGERLQGFPDDWTRWLANGSEQSDSARYRELGNAVAVPVAAWITGRLAAAEEAGSAARSSIDEGRAA